MASTDEQVGKQHENATKLVPAVERAVIILDIISESGDLRLAEIVKRSKLPKSSVHGLCQTLVHLQLLQSNSAGVFSIGPKSMRWSNAFLDNSNIVDAFHAALAEAPKLESYTVTLSRLEQDDVIYLSYRNAATPLGITFRIGMRVPAVFTATGKAMLAAMDRDKFDRQLPQVWPAPITSTSVTTREHFEQELHLIRAQGYSLDNGQLREGMYCIGSAICDRSGDPVAGVALSMTEAEARPDAIRASGAEIVALAERISSRMGWR